VTSAASSRVAGIAFGLGLAFFAAYQQFKLPVVLPVLLADFGYDRTLAGGFMSVYAFAGLLLSIPLGRAIQRHGAANLILAALVLMTMGSALVVAAPESGWLVLAARGLEGVAFAVLAISGPVLANASASPAALPLVIGLTATWIPVGQLTATFLAPLAIATAGWRLLWYLGIAGAVVFALWTLMMKRRRHPGLAPATEVGPRRQPADTSTLDAGRKRALILAGAVFMLWSGQYFAYMTWLPQYLVEVHGLDITGAQWGYAIPVALVLTFCVITGWLLQRGVSLPVLMLVALAAQAAVWWWLPWTGGGAGGIASLVIYGIGGGVVPTCLFAMPSAIMGGGHGTARAFGVVMTGRNMGVLIGPVLLAQAFKLSGTWSLAAPIFGAVTTLCLLLAMALVRRLP
jgi:MFS family permease